MIDELDTWKNFPRTYLDQVEFLRTSLSQPAAAWTTIIIRAAAPSSAKTRAGEHTAGAFDRGDFHLNLPMDNPIMEQHEARQERVRVECQQMRNEYRVVKENASFGGTQFCTIPPIDLARLASMPMTCVNSFFKIGRCDSDQGYRECGCREARRYSC